MAERKPLTTPLLTPVHMPAPFAHLAVVVAAVAAAVQPRVMVLLAEPADSPQGVEEAAVQGSGLPILVEPEEPAAPDAQSSSLTSDNGLHQSYD